MRSLVPALAALALMGTSVGAYAEGFDMPSWSPRGDTKAIAAAIADPARPEADVKRDPDRKPLEALEFAGVHPGEKVADLIAGGGYFTRLFAKAVGPTGHVYTIQPAEIIKIAPKYLDEIKSVTSAYPNVTLIIDPLPQALNTPEKLDLVWTSQNYHDMHDPFMGPEDMAAVNKAVFDALKPGGVYVVLDHAAAPGSGLSATNTLHRIDPEAVKREVLAAGFIFDGESKILRNPADPHTANVFDKSIRGHTDQFIYRFRKPRK
ncbi:MAG TPA: methyltransferase [Caulobacteraceae bacterium]|jgi:predicted methyltransferase|nr:methyltransferase [Caulobacteraceae bacterium]